MEDTPKVKRPVGRPRKDQLAKNPRDWNFSLPIAARKFAIAFVTSGFDEYKAIRKLLESVGKEATSRSDYEVADMARKAMENVSVKAEIQRMFLDAGLDEEHGKKFVTMLWEWMCGDDLALKQTAARILGKAFIAERVVVDKPEDLKLAGLNEGLKAMGLRRDSENDEEKVN